MHLHKLAVSKYLILSYPIRLVLPQHLNSHVTYSGIPPENSNHRRIPKKQNNLHTNTFEFRC